MDMARTRPHDALRPFVREYIGWRDSESGPIVRREPPADLVPFIINFGSPVRFFTDDRQTSWREFGSFTTGVFDTYVLIGTLAGSAGLQVNFTIPGARLLLGQPLGALLNTGVPLDDVFGRAADDLASRLFDAPDWAARFAIVETGLLRRLAAVRPPSPQVMQASARLRASRGRLGIDALVKEIGCSQKHLVAQFRRELGVTPKRLARILRFDHALDGVRNPHARLADVALSCGYCDQAHLDRECRALAGVSPTDLRLESAPGVSVLPVR